MGKILDGNYEEYFGQGARRFTAGWVEAFFAGKTVRDPRGYTLEDYVAPTDIQRVTCGWARNPDPNKKGLVYDLTFSLDSGTKLSVNDLKPGMIPVVMNVMSLARNVDLGAPEEPTASFGDIIRRQLEDVENDCPSDREIMEYKLDGAEKEISELKEKLELSEKRRLRVEEAASELLGQYDKWEVAGQQLLQRRRALWAVVNQQ